MSQKQSIQGWCRCNPEERTGGRLKCGSVLAEDEVGNFQHGNRDRVNFDVRQTKWTGEHGVKDTPCKGVSGREGEAKTNARVMLIPRNTSVFDDLKAATRRASGKLACVSRDHGKSGPTQEHAGSSADISQPFQKGNTVSQLTPCLLFSSPR